MRRLALTIILLLANCRSTPDSTEKPGDRPNRVDDQPKPSAAPDSGPPAKPAQKTAEPMKPTLSQQLEDEIATIRKDPLNSVGFGEKSYLPYEPNEGASLIGADSTDVTARLLAEASGGGDRIYRLAILHILGKRTDSTVDAALITLLDDPELRATAAYLLARPGFKGYLPRQHDLRVVLAALRKHLDDATTFTDPFYKETFPTQDFVIAAYIRLAGPDKFHIANRDKAELIGLSLPRFTDAERTDLLAQAKKLQ